MSRQDHVGDGDGAGIDERVARLAALIFELDDGVERTARRLAADALPQFVADQAQRQRQGKDLGDALDRKRHLAVARGRDVAGAVDHHKAEALVVNARQFRDVIRDLAAVRPLRHLVGDFLDDGIEVGGGAAHLISACGSPAVTCLMQQTRLGHCAKRRRSLQRL